MKFKVLSLMLIVTILVSLASFTTVFSYDSWTIEETIDYLYNNGDFAAAPVPEIAKGIDALYYEYEAQNQSAGYLYADANFARKAGDIQNLTKEQVVAYFEDVKASIQTQNNATPVDRTNVHNVTLQALADALSTNNEFYNALRVIFTNKANVLIELQDILQNDANAVAVYDNLVFGAPDIWDLVTKSQNRPSFGGGGGGSSVGTKPNGTFTGVASVALYNDIDESHWAYEYVEHMSQVGIMNGVGNQKFDPEGNLTRASVVKMLAALVNAEVAVTKVSFIDVPESAWHNPYVAWGFENGIVKGYSDTEFAPDKIITREEISAMIVRFFDKFEVACEPVIELKLFNDDADIQEYAYDSVYTLQQADIFHGKPNYMFAPQAATTRAEAAKIFSGIYDIYQKHLNNK